MENKFDMAKSTCTSVVRFLVLSSMVGLLFGFKGLFRPDSISVCIGPSPREREKEERNDRREKKYSNNLHPHPLQVAHPTIFRISWTPRLQALPSSDTLKK